MVPPGDRSERSILLDVYEELGRLGANVQILLDDRGRASDSRREMHEKIDHVDDCLHRKIEEVKTSIDAVKAQIAPVIKTVSELEPVVKELNTKRQQVIGAVWGVTWVGRIAWFLIGVLGTALGFLIKFFAS